MVRTDSKLPRCSFCGKTQNEVRKLIAGPGVYICSDCINLCNEIISDEFDMLESGDPNIDDYSKDSSLPKMEIPKPTDIPP